MSTAADLLADLLAPAANADPEATPAKAANSAKSKQPCGLAADSGAANGLRKAANFCESGPVWGVAQRIVLGYLEALGPLDLRNLAAAAQLPPGEALAALRGLRELGHVTRVGDCWRITNRAAAAADAFNATRGAGPCGEVQPAGARGIA